MDLPRVVGIDLSKTLTGLADSSGRVARVHSQGSVADPLASKVARLRDIAARVAAFVDHRGEDGPELADLVVIEGPSYGSIAGQQHDLGGLWYATVGQIIDDVPVVVVTPGQRAKYATGTTAKKELVLLAAVRRYEPLGWTITDNNVADAVILMAMGRRLLGHPIEPSLPKTHLAALDKVRLP